MECIILVRDENGEISAIMEDLNLAVFPNLDEAITFVDKSRYCQTRLFQIVECDEL